MFLGFMNYWLYKGRRELQTASSEWHSRHHPRELGRPLSAANHVRIDKMCAFDSVISMFNGAHGMWDWSNGILDYFVNYPGFVVILTELQRSKSVGQGTLTVVKEEETFA